MERRTMRQISVGSIINITYFILIVIIFGIITILSNEVKPRKKQSVTKKDYILTFFMGILGTIIIFLKLKEIGWIAYLISFFGGFLIIFLYILFLKED